MWKAINEDRKHRILQPGGNNTILMPMFISFINQVTEEINSETYTFSLFVNDQHIHGWQTSTLSSSSQLTDKKAAKIKAEMIKRCTTSAAEHD